MTEKNMQTFFGKFISNNPPPHAEAYELKFSKKNSIPFNVVQPHQITALMNSRRGGFFHKITDQPWGYTMNVRYTSKKPFDCFILANTPAFVVIWFYRPREKRIFVKIPIEVFLNEATISSRKSLTEIRAFEIGEAIEIILPKEKPAVNS